MALAMTRPTKHPKSGTYVVRMAIPEDIRDACKRRYGARTELRENLGTKDAKQAKASAPAAMDRLRAKLAAARLDLAGGPSVATDRDIAALAGDFYRDQLATYGDNPGPWEGWDIAEDCLYDQIEQVEEDPASPRYLRLRQRDRDEAASRLSARGMATDPETVRRAAEAIFHADLSFAQSMKRRATGDWSPDGNLERFPTAARQVAASPPPPAGLTYDDLLTGWARDRGLDMNARPIARAAYDRKQTIRRLGDFLGHRDATRVTKADAVRWKEDMQARGRAVATVRNDLSEMSAVWTWAIRNGKLELNPFAGISPAKEKGKKRQRRAFTQAEAVAILTAARGNSGYMRWLPWVCCLTGARISEVCQSTKDDLVTLSGVPVLRITDEGDADDDTIRSIKNEDSRRNVPIHPALIAEGFLDYVGSLPAGSALFPDARPDNVFGLRSTNAGKKVSRWLRTDLGIADPRISPNHSWRHFFISACRAAEMNPEVRSALTGHSARMDESAGYGDG